MNDNSPSSPEVTKYGLLSSNWNWKLTFLNPFLEASVIALNSTSIVSLYSRVIFPSSVHSGSNSSKIILEPDIGKIGILIPDSQGPKSSVPSDFNTISHIPGPSPSSTVNSPSKSSVSVVLFTSSPMTNSTSKPSSVSMIKGQGSSPLASQISNSILNSSSSCMVWSLMLSSICITTGSLSSSPSKSELEICWISSLLLIAKTSAFPADIKETSELESNAHVWLLSSTSAAEIADIDINEITINSSKNTFLFIYNLLYIT